MSQSTGTTIRGRLPWSDRWTEPTLEQLIEVHSDSESSKPVLVSLLEKIGAFTGVERSLKWRGTAWNWTVQFDLMDATGKHLDILAYVVPKPGAPQLCVPLTDPQIAHLPVRRLHRFIRDGIRDAKFGVEIHWAAWNPTGQSEVDQLVDLIKRKHKALVAAVTAQA